MNKKNIGNQNAEILFIVKQIDENQLTNNCNYHTLHNLITYRQTNRKVLFKNDFFIIETTKLEEFQIDLNKFKLIIIESEDKFNELIDLFKGQEVKETKCNKAKYSFFKNFKKRKIIIHLNNFNDFSKDNLAELNGDILLVSINYSLKNDNSYFDKNGIFGRKDIVYYQFTCANCNEYNLKIIHKSEPKPDRCKSCNEPLLNSNRKLKSEMLILENEKLITINDKL